MSRSLPLRTADGEVPAPGSLTSYTEFAPEFLGPLLHDVVSANAHILRARNMPGVVKRYTEEDPVEWVTQGQVNISEGRLGAYVVANENSGFAGSVSYEPIDLVRLRFSGPPVLARPFGERFRHAKPMVRAWTVGNDSDMLEHSYKKGRQLALMSERIVGSFPFTVEPSGGSRVNVVANSAILLADFVEVDRGQYDDQESRRNAPPEGILYVASPVEAAPDKLRNALKFGSEALSS